MRISDWSSDVCSSDLAAGNLVNSNFVNGIDTFNPVPGGCTNDNFYISAANGRCVYDFNATAADEASYGNKAFFLNGEIQINDDWSTYFTTNVPNSKSFGRYAPRSEEHTSELQSLMRLSYAAFCLKKKKIRKKKIH